MWKRECARLDLDRGPVLTQSHPPLTDVTPIQGANGKLSFSDADATPNSQRRRPTGEATSCTNGLVAIEAWLTVVRGLPLEHLADQLRHLGLLYREVQVGLWPI